MASIKVVGEGDSYEGALADIKSAIPFHLESYGADALDPCGSRQIWLMTRGTPVRPRWKSVDQQLAT